MNSAALLPFSIMAIARGQITLDGCPYDESYSGGGYDYRGCKTETIDGEACILWPSDYVNDQTLTHHNYCRNIDDDVHEDPVPWCLTGLTGNVYSYGYCFEVPAGGDEAG